MKVNIFKVLFLSKNKKKYMVRVCFFEKKIIFDKKYDDIRAFDGTGTGTRYR